MSKNDNQLIRKEKTYESTGRINMHKSVWRRILAYSKQELPIEACGYIAGVDNTVTHFFPMENTDKSPDHFSFDPEEQFRIVHQARALGIKILGNFHSHPNSPARPSEEDIRLAYDPNLMYCIISLQDNIPELKIFSIKEKEVNEITLDLI